MRLRHIEVMMQTRAFQQADRALGVAETELERRIHVGRARQSFVEPAQRRVVVRPHQPIDDAPDGISRLDSERRCFEPGLVASTKLGV